MQGRTGRIQLGQQVRLLDKRAADALAAIAEVRNDFAHRPRNIGSSLEAYAEALSTQEKQVFLRQLMGLAHDEPREELRKPDWLPDAMRFVIWLVGGQILEVLAVADGEAERARDRKSVV